MASRNPTVVGPLAPIIYFSSKDLSVFAKVLNDAMAARESSVTVDSTNGRELLHIMAAAIISRAEDGERDRVSLMNAALGAANAVCTGAPLGFVSVASADSPSSDESTNTASAAECSER